MAGKIQFNKRGAVGSCYLGGRVFLAFPGFSIIFDKPDGVNLKIKILLNRFSIKTLARFARCRLIVSSTSYENIRALGGGEKFLLNKIRLSNEF